MSPARHADRLALFAILAGCSTLLSASASATDLALGNPCTWSVAPNYVHCTDPEDASQLTDGEHAHDDYGWIDTASVGWELHMGNVVTFVLDLGAACELDSLCFSTFEFPTSGVVPPALVCGTRDVDSLFTYAAALPAPPLELMASPGLPRRVQLALPLGGVRGRHVLVAALLQTRYLVVDEIEVHGRRAIVGAAARSSGASRAVAPFGVHNAPAFFAMVRRLWAVRAALPSDPGSLFPEVAPREEERARLEARARSWRATGTPPLQVRRVDPWATTTPWSGPQAEFGDTMHLARGGWGAIAVEVACSAATPLRVSATLLHAARGAPRATLRQVLCVESRDARWAGDALPLLDAPLELLPGEVRQIWLDVDARPARPGLHWLQLAIDSETLRVPVRVHAVRSPPPPLGACSFTYPTKRALTRDVAAAAVRDNVEHGIDTWLLPEEDVPWPDRASIDARGHIGRPVDFAACDAALALHNAHRARAVGWFWYMLAEGADPTLGKLRLPYMSPAWRRAASEWMRTWLLHLRARGYDMPQLFMMPFDERAGPRVAEFLRFVKQQQPGLRIALTFPGGQEPRDLAVVEPYVDIAIPHRRLLDDLPEVVRRVRERGGRIWTYDTPEPSKLVSPLAGYRLLPWQAWTLRLATCCVWAYADCGDERGNAWNDFDGERPDFAAVYGAEGAPLPLAEPLVPSKRWQAFRIGMLDVALLAAAEPRRPGLRASARAALERPTTRGVERLVREALTALP